MSSMNEVPRVISITWAILGPVVLVMNTGLVARPSGVYPPADYGDMAIACGLMLAGWAQEGPAVVQWVRRKLGRAAELDREAV